MAATRLPGAGRSELRARARALEPVAEAVSDGIVVADRNGCLLLFNETARRVLGRGRLRIAPERWSEAYGLYLPDEVTPFPAADLPLARAIRGEECRDVEVHIRRSDRLLAGSRAIRVNAFPWRDGSGELLGGIVVFRDVTAQRLADSTLRRLYNAVELTTDCVYITDAHGVIEYVNGGFEATTGYSRAEALGQSPRLLRSGLHGPDHYRELWDTLLAGQVYRGTMANRRRDGRIYYAEMTVTPIRGPHGTITHFVAVGRDTTERRLRQEQEVELNLARAVQRGLFPEAPPLVPGLEMAGVAHPATAMCGDYYDFVPMGGNRVGIAIADVSGHGLGPALVMAETRAYLRAYLETQPRVEEALRALHRTLRGDLSGGNRFVTMLLAQVDAEAGEIAYANAGHPPGFVIGPDGEVRATLESSGPPLGIPVATAVLDAEPVPVRPGDVLLLLTDGITETASPDGHLLGVEGALGLVRRHLGGTARQIVDGLVAGVREFAGGGPPADDITAVACRIGARP